MLMTERIGSLGRVDSNPINKNSLDSGYYQVTDL